MKKHFTDDALDLIKGLEKTSGGATISNHVTGTKIHTGFMENGKGFTNLGIKVDGLKNGILYELKPCNARGVLRAIKQMKDYQSALSTLGNVRKLVLVLY